MTILPKEKKKSHSLAKAERYNTARGAHSSPSSGNPTGNSGHEHHRYAASSNAPATGIASNPSHQLNNPSNKKSSRKQHSCGIALTSNQSQGQMSPNVVGSSLNSLLVPAASLNSPQSPSANPSNMPTLQSAGKVLEKSVAVPASSSKRKPGSTPKNKQTHQQNIENCNSDDEYGDGRGFKDDELEIRFAERLKKARGLVIKEVKGDGACMFRAVADQIYGDEEMHVDVRTLCMDYIGKNRDHFSQFLTEDFDIYLTRKREMETHGNHVELQAISEIFSRPIEIFEYSIDPINTFHPISPEANTGIGENPPIRLSYHGTIHYNSVIDPFTATIGVGLGLPEFKPGMADRNLMKEASIASETQHIEEAMLNDKLRMTDWERTEEELSKQIAKDSYMQYLCELEGKEPAEDQISYSVDLGKSRPGSPNLTSPLSVATTVTEEQQRSSPSARFGQRSSTTNANYSRLSSSAGAGCLGSKRGASSPNIPCCSRDDRDRISGYSPMAKVHRNDASCSMPNIGPDFGKSFLSQSVNNDSMRPSTSASSLQRSYGDELCASAATPGPDSQSRRPANAPVTSSGLYEELLASSALAYDDDWGSSTTALDEAAMLARVMAVSQAEFYDALRKSPK